MLSGLVTSELLIEAQQSKELLKIAPLWKLFGSVARSTKGRESRGVECYLDGHGVYACPLAR